jgi:hypothetical protein
MKTVQEYMNDPALVNEPMALREVHAARLKIQDETKNMTIEEKTLIIIMELWLSFHGLV